MTRQRICLLGAPLDNFYSSQFWKGAADEARALGMDLVHLAGGLQRIYYGGFAEDCALTETRSTLLYQMADPAMFDGILVWGAQWGHDADQAVMQAALAPFAPLPVVSVGWAGKGVYGILPDNYSGMRRLTDHLVRDHGHEKVVYLKSEASYVQWEAEQRFQGYCDALLDAGVEPEPRLIVYGHEIERKRNESMLTRSNALPWGALAVEDLLDHRGLKPGRDFTALIARDDDGAMAACAELRRRGIAIPREVAICGFDDLQVGRCSTPTLTTVPQSFAMQAAAGMRLLDSIFRGETVPPLTKLESPPPIIRESCGCLNHHIRGALPGAAPVERADAESRQAFARVNRVLDGIPKGRHSLADLAEAIEAGVRTLREAGGDPLELAEVLGNTAAKDPSEDWQRMVRAAQIFTGDCAERAQLRERILFQEKQDELDIINRDIFRTYDVNQVLDSVEAELPVIGARGCTILLFSDPKNPLDSARVLFSSSNGVRRADTGVSSPEVTAGSVFSREFWPDRESPYSLYAEPLFFSRHRIGCLIMERGDSDGRSYPSLASRLASVLEGAFIVRNLNEKQAELEKAYAEILNLSERDTLTGLFNRRAIQREILNEKHRMDRYTSREHPVFSLLFIDLDHFKYYNDTFGHSVGDAALKAFAELLCRCVRVTDLVSRFGGDEFLVLLPETRADGAIALADRIQSEIRAVERLHARITELTGQTIAVPREKRITCSIGISTYRSGDDTDVVIQRADRALYNAKTGGRDRYCVEAAE